MDMYNAQLAAQQQETRRYRDLLADASMEFEVGFFLSHSEY